MMPDKPEPLEVSVVEAKIKLLKDDKHEDGRFRIDCIKSSGGMSGWTWMGMLAKDLYRGKSWHKIVLKLKPLYLC